MPVSLQNERGNNLFFTGLLIMLVSLFTARAVLSISVILFLLISLAHGDHIAQVKTFFKVPLLWNISLLFLIPLISGFWSTDLDQWKEIIRIKLPLLFLPFAFASPFRLSQRQWEIMAFVAVILVFLATVGSTIAYLMERRLTDDSYLGGKSLQTAFGNDRVRFSWVVGLTVPGAAWAATSYWSKKRSLAILLLIIACWLAVYLHILSVRTGLFSFYIILFSVFVFMVRDRKRSGWIILSLLIILPLAAWFILPSFQNRVKYLDYEFDFAKNRSYLPGSTDPVRIISIQAGIEQYRSAPVWGLGFGDIQSSSRKWYAENYPAMKEQDMILPSSEFVLYTTGAGILGYLSFFSALLTPFFMKLRQRRAWLLLSIAVLVSLLFDIGLEVQFGVFIYCFVVLGFWKWMVSENR
jgi:O-antigen ligase